MEARKSYPQGKVGQLVPASSFEPKATARWVHRGGLMAQWPKRHDSTVLGPHQPLLSPLACLCSLKAKRCQKKMGNKNCKYARAAAARGVFPVSRHQLHPSSQFRAQSGEIENGREWETEKMYFWNPDLGQPFS